MPLDQLKRREFIALLGGAAAWPVAARAQQAAMPVVGVLDSASRDDPIAAVQLRAFHQGLAEIGYTEGQNVLIEYRWAENKYDRLAALAADLVRRKVTVIVASGGATSALAAKAATTTIPIVFSTGGDPIKLGLVSSLNRPGGNLTGTSSLGNVLVGKQLQLLREVMPKADAIIFLVNPDNRTAESDATDVQGAARLLGQQVDVLKASTPSDIDAAFGTLAHSGPVGCSLPATCSLMAALIRLPRWRSATRCRRFSWLASSRRLAA